MLHLLQRHPFAMRAHFDFSLVLTYAYPAPLLTPLLPAGLTLDTYEGVGFLAIALVKVRGLRPVGWPAAMGSDFFLTGYRLFVRYRTSRGKNLRGLYILRSDTDSRVMAAVGRLTTHYAFARANVLLTQTADAIDVRLSTPGAVADLAVTAYLSQPVDAPPVGSPFPDLAKARRFAGPLPFTFSPEPQTNAMVLVEGRRDDWTPRPVAVTVHRATFLQTPPFADAPTRLANAFLVTNIPYEWKSGTRDPLTTAETVEAPRTTA